MTAVFFHFDYNISYNTRHLGREFDAVFISTCEEVHNGKAFDHTRSLSNHYVFNTTITRSRHLVVAVGNPHLLIKTEKNMVAQSGGSSYPCWTPFLRKCCTFNQFHMPQNVISKIPEDKYKTAVNFFNTVLFKETLDFSANLKMDDTILKAYTETYEGEYDSKKASKRLTQASNQGMFEYDLETDGIEYEDTYDCILDATTFNKARAFPIDSNKSTVHILGKQNRRNALNGDTVKVGTFADFLQDKVYGRVIKIIQRVENLNFVCEVSQKNPDWFSPIDGKNPRFINFPYYSHMLRGHQSEVENKSSQHKSVIVFNQATYTKEGPMHQAPKVADFIDHKTAMNMAFVVKFVAWNPKYVRAFGLVTDAYPKGYTHLTAEIILSIVHSIPLYQHKSEDYPPPQTSSHTPATSLLDIPFPNAFTIDPKEARNLDDALTLVKQSETKESEQVYQFGVHIVDASKHLDRGDKNDLRARNQGSAYYYRVCGKNKMIPMLPSDFLEDLSLTPGNVRDVWSVTCDVYLNENGEVIKTDKVQIEQSQVRSVLQLSYEKAQDILCGKYEPEDVSPYDSLSLISMEHTLKMLNSLSLHFARKRLKSDAMYWCQNTEDSIQCWQSHKIIEEFMIWANSEVAEKLYSLYPSGALLRCQKPPEDKHLVDFTESLAGTLAMAYDLSQFYKGEEKLQHFMVAKNVLADIGKKKAEGDAVGIAGIIMSNLLFPQLSVALSKRNAICQRSKYHCTVGNHLKKDYYHDNLRLEAYTHFTSPLRRYVDILVQRLLVGDTDLHLLEEDELKKLNNLSSKAKNIEIDFGRVDFSLSLMHNSKVFQACIESNTRTRLSFKCLNIQQKHRTYEIRTANLGPFMPFSSNSKKSSKTKYCWKVKISSLNETDLNTIRGITISKLPEKEHKSDSYIEAYRNIDDEMEMVTFQISISGLCTFINCRDWTKALAFTKNPTVDNLESLNWLSQYQDRASSVSSKEKIAIGTAQYPFVNYFLSLSLEEADVFNMWLNMRRRKCLPESTVQLIQLSPLLHICVQHNTFPSKCFSNEFLRNASRHRYRSIKEYTDLWEGVLLSEAAVASVHEPKVFILRGAQLKWPEFSPCPVTGEEALLYEVIGQVTLEISKGYVENMFEYFNIKTGDFICARYGTDSHTYHQANVFHFVVKHVQKVNNEMIDDLIITMDICKQEGRVSKNVQSFLLDNPLCEIQIISMSTSYR